MDVTLNLAVRSVLSTVHYLQKVGTLSPHIQFIDARLSQYKLLRERMRIGSLSLYSVVIVKGQHPM